MKKAPYFFEGITTIIWDMDGVLSDTQKFHAEVESLLLSKYQITISPSEITTLYAGVSDDTMFNEIFEKRGKKAPNIDELSSQKWNIMKKVTEGKITAIPHALELIKEFKKNNFNLAIASASTLEFIQYVIDSLQVTKNFTSFVSAQEVKHGKPAPDIFLLAAKKMGVRPDQCVVIEDGVSGMIGAHSAGMRCIGLVQKKTKQVPADIIVTSLEQVRKNVYK